MRRLAPHFHRELLIAICMLIAGLFLGKYFLAETIVVRESVPDTPAAMHSVHLMLDAGDGAVRTWNTVSWHEAMSAIDLLEFVGNTEGLRVTTDGSDKDRVVVQVGEVATNETARWQYWVNNTYEPRVAGKYFLKPGDIVVWKFTKEQEN